jgi:hypothetical protein
VWPEPHRHGGGHVGQVLAQFLLARPRIGREGQGAWRGVFGCRLGHQKRSLEGPDARVGATRQWRALANAIQHRAANAIIRKSSK